MRLLSSELTQDFVLFLENCDGPTWNKLASDLCSIYARSQEDSNFFYLANAASLASIYANAHFQEFQKTNGSYFTSSVRISLIGYASVQVATDFFREFEIGNVY